MEELPDCEPDKPPDYNNFRDMAVDCDRREDERHPFDPESSKAVKESISSRTIGGTDYNPSSYTEGDRLPLGCFYTPTNDGASPSSPSSLSSSSLKRMSVNSRHMHSSSLPAPPVVGPAPTALLSPAASSTRCSPSKPTVPCFEAQLVEPAASTLGSPGKKSSKSVSRLCFPFVKRNVKDKSVSGSANPSEPAAIVPPTPVTLPMASSLPRRHKHSCPPTRFSPLSVKRAPPLQKRHAYVDHGYSQEALEHLKWFWNVRHEGGTMEKKPLVATIHPQMRGSVGEPSPGVPRSSVPATETATDPAASIHPRRGDISALRNPQCAEVDGSFGALGVWTIAKMVWMVELDVGIEMLEREKEKQERKRRSSRLRMRILWDEHESEDEDERGSLKLSMSSGSLSDDSETTLVEAESSSFEKGTGDSDEDDDERLQMVIRGRKLTPQGRDRSILSARSGPATPVSPGRELLGFDRSPPLSLYQTLWDSKSTKLTGAGCCRSEWATNWTSQWEIVRTFSQA